MTDRKTGLIIALWVTAGVCLLLLSLWPPVFSFVVGLGLAGYGLVGMVRRKIVVTGRGGLGRTYDGPTAFMFGLLFFVGGCASIYFLAVPKLWPALL